MTFCRDIHSTERVKPTDEGCHGFEFRLSNSKAVSAVPTMQQTCAHLAVFKGKNHTKQ